MEKYIIPELVTNMLDTDDKGAVSGIVPWLEALKNHDYTGIRAKQQGQETATSAEVQEITSDEEVPSKKHKS